MSGDIALPSNILTSEQVLAQKYAPKTTEEALGRDAFLKLFTTQLKSQDPLSPMENEAFVSQLAQFSSLESMKAMQGAIEDMSGGMLRERLMTGTGMLGRSIPSMSGNVLGGGDREINFSAVLTDGADSVLMMVKNTSGEVVYEEEFGARPASEMKFLWDGKDSAGNVLPLEKYQITVNVERGDTGWAVPVKTQELIKAVRWDEEASEMVFETESGTEINLAQLNRIEM
jgi:flagellar basal-body rod modification protein FlgD